jgi:hypothetical protein
MVKRRVKKKQKRRVRKRLPATVRTEPVDRKPILGGGGSFSVIPSNPFQEGISNMMTAVQQNLNNNLNTTLNQLKVENQLMNEKLMAMQYDQQKATKQGNELMSIELRKQIDDYTKVLDTKYGLMNNMEEWMMKALQMPRQGRLLPPASPVLHPRAMTQDEETGDEQLDDIKSPAPVPIEEETTGTQAGGKTYTRAVYQLLSKNNRIVKNHYVGYIPDLKNFLESLDENDLKGIFGEVGEKGLSSRGVKDKLDKLFDYVDDETMTNIDKQIEEIEQQMKEKEKDASTALSKMAQKTQPAGASSSIPPKEKQKGKRKTQPAGASSSTPSPARNTMTTQNDLVFTPA